MTVTAAGRDDGVVALPLLGIALVLLAAALALAAGAHVAIAGSRARTAADLAALAAAQHLGSAELACDEAARFATANGARLLDCAVTEQAVALRVAVTVTATASRLGLPRQIAASARAGYPP